MRKHFLLTALSLSFCLILFTSCAAAVSDSYNTSVAVNGEIRSETRGAAQQAYRDVLNDLRNDADINAVLPLPLDRHTPQTEDSGRAVEFSPRLSLQEVVANPENILSEVHVSFGKGMMEEQRIGCGDFYFALEPYAREMYVVLSTFKQGHLTFLVYTSFARIESEWELYEMRWDDYAYGGMDSAALYAKARQLDGQKKTIPAAVYAYCAGYTLAPCGVVYEFNDEVVIGSEPLLNAINLRNRFPHTLLLEEASEDNQNHDGNTVTLLGFEPVMTAEDGISVVVKYITETNIEDVAAAQEATFAKEHGEEVETAPFTETQMRENERTVTVLKKETQLLLKYIDADFAGITETFDAVHMAAFNRIEAEEPANTNSAGQPQSEAGSGYEYICYTLVESVPAE